MKSAPPNRHSKAREGVEEHFQEAAVMLAFAMHLFDSGAECLEVSIHPDGEHGKRFDIAQWLTQNRFALVSQKGSTSYGGVYQRDSQRIIVNPTSGKGDVVAMLGGVPLVAECKGGIINTAHAGQKSRLRRGLCGTVGLLLAREAAQERQIAVVPFTDEILRLASRIAPRAAKAGIEIALIARDGKVSFVMPKEVEA
jgi:hypothetical protein